MLPVLSLLVATTVPLLDVNPVGVWGPLIVLSLLIAIPILVVVYFLVRALRRQVQQHRDRDR